MVLGLVYTRVQCPNEAVPEHPLKECAGCSNVAYCSRECQKLDWKQGGHRKACFEIQNERLGKAFDPSEILPLSAKLTLTACQI